MITPPPQISNFGWEWRKWFSELWNKVIHTDGGQAITGRLTLTSTEESDLSGVTGVLLIGSDGTTQHLAVDPNEIHSKSDSTTAGTLNLQPHGGSATFGAVVALATFDIDSTNITLTSAQIDMPSLPTSDPTVAGRLWNNSGVLTVSAG